MAPEQILYSKSSTQTPWDGTCAGLSCELAWSGAIEVSEWPAYSARRIGGTTSVVSMLMMTTTLKILGGIAPSDRPRLATIRSTARRHADADDGHAPPPEPEHRRAAADQLAEERQGGDRERDGHDRAITEELALCWIHEGRHFKKLSTRLVAR